MMVWIEGFTRREGSREHDLGCGHDRIHHVETVVLGKHRPPTFCKFSELLRDLANGMYQQPTEVLVVLGWQMDTRKLLVSPPPIRGT